MRRTASEVIRNLEVRIARLEKQSAKEKTLFERASNSDKKKVHEILRDEMYDHQTSDPHHEENHTSSRGGHTFNASIHVTYKVPLRPICKDLSRHFGQKVTRSDIQPFLDDFYTEEMNLDGRYDDIKRSGFYDLGELSAYPTEDLDYFLDHKRTYIGTEIEIEDVDGDYLIAGAHISVSNENDNF